MEQDPFWNLARELVIDILSRLPIPSIIRCRSVCKSWLDLVECAEFAKSHESRSSLYLVLSFPTTSIPHKFIEIVDELDPQNYLPHCNLAFSFSFPLADGLYVNSSVNGLLFLRSCIYVSGNHKLFICNPLTRQYINLPHCSVRGARRTYGFGVTKMSGQYKLIRITKYSSAESQYCEVYTLGTGSWRRIDATLPHGYDEWTSAGAFLNGNLHWLVTLYDVDPEISYFDLETECVSSFSLPPLETGYDRRFIHLSALGDCLCLCDNSDCEKNIDFWLMKEYGDDKSWVKEFIINIPLHNDSLGFRSFFPVKVIKDGDILFGDDECARLFCYFNKTKTIQRLLSLDDIMYYLDGSCLYTPRFLDLLKTFAMENVCSF